MYYCWTPKHIITAWEEGEEEDMFWGPNAHLSSVKSIFKQKRQFFFKGYDESNNISIQKQTDVKALR